MTHSLILDLPCHCEPAWLLLDCLIQLLVFRHVIFTQMLWDCIFWCWEHCTILAHGDPWLPVSLPLRNLSWLHPDTTMPTFLLYNVLFFCSAVIDFSITLVLHSCYHFIVTLLRSFSLYLTLPPQWKTALFFIAQFEIYLWQEGHWHVSLLLAIEQYSHNWFQIWKFVQRQKIKCVSALFY